MKRHFAFIISMLATTSVFFASCSKEDDGGGDPPPPADTLTVNIGVDKTILEGESATLDAGHAGSTYLWSTGATTQSIAVDTTGTFWVKVTNGSKAGSDTVKITLSYKLPKIETDFGTMLILAFKSIPQNGLYPFSCSHNLPSRRICQ